MISILIADDEKLARGDILYKVSRSGFNYKWVMEAASAEDALNMIKEYKPDILLTDIMMGEMSGIDLVRAARTSSLNIVSILISGYSEFSLAKEAIALNVVDYLLKPVRQEELNAALSTAVSKVINQRNILLLPMQFDKTIDEKLDVIQKEQLFAFLNGMETKLNFPAALLFPQKTAYYQIGILQLNQNQSDMECSEMDNRNIDRFRQMVQDVVREIGGEEFLIFSHIMHKHQITLLAASADSDIKKASNKLAGKFGEIYRKIQCKVKDGTVHMGISGLDETISGSLINQTRQALDLRLSPGSNPKGDIYFWEVWKKYVAVQLPEEQIKLYQNFLAAGDLNQTLDAVRRIFSSEQPGAALHVRMLYVELMCILARTSIKKAGGSVVSMLGTETLSGSIIDKFASREEMIENLCRTITTALGQWMAVTADASSVLLVVKSYVENNFTNSEICTNFLSKQFCISLGYLSTSYKKEFGVTISKQIINLRMDYAKKLLKETKLNILDISENCGFNNLSYFMRTFKKYTGSTPNEFRENDE
ncbi:response regulator transcription factor [Anaerocolumna sp. MB42-C2]|uniref:response regulator transcription factor n=1 Tax=Anaerocolumna sp. MB42-C2 TaxID=3070997 RepID=UPI0027DF187C|nr:response regulator [Anaerocolumna sp. MB42-C2]WMJ89925.1 response regulator [Anaerocolumna sp. MB42-C2]